MLTFEDIEGFLGLEGFEGNQGYQRFSGIFDTVTIFFNIHLKMFT